MAGIQLWTNSRPLFTAVTLGNGDFISLPIKPNEFFFDEEGYVRLFSRRFEDGRTGNFKLLPRNQTEDAVLRFMKSWLVPFGLTIASNVIIHGDTIIHNLAQELFERGGQLYIDDIFERYSIANSCYYEIATGELVITHPIRDKDLIVI